MARCPRPVPGAPPFSICLVLDSRASGGLRPDPPFPFLPGLAESTVVWVSDWGSGLSATQTCWVTGKLVFSWGANVLIYGVGLSVLSGAVGRLNGVRCEYSPGPDHLLRGHLLLEATSTPLLSELGRDEKCPPGHPSQLELT